MKSASVLRPGSGRNLHITPNGLLKAINTSGEAALDEIARYGRLGYRVGSATTAVPAPAIAPGCPRLEPLAHVGVEPHAEHVVIECLAESRPEIVVVRAGRILEYDIVVRKTNVRRRVQRDAIGIRVESDGRVRRGREAVPVRRLDAAGREQLTHTLERIDGVLLGFGREAVH